MKSAPDSEEIKYHSYLVTVAYKNRKWTQSWPQFTPQLAWDNKSQRAKPGSVRSSYSKPCWQPETIFLCTSSFAKPHDIQGSIHWLLSVSCTYRSPYFLLRTSFQNQIANCLLWNKNTSRESTSRETRPSVQCASTSLVTQGWSLP